MTRTLRAAAAAALVAIVAVPAGPAAGGADGGWHLVRYDHRITGADHDALEAAGARALQYFPADSYLSWMGAGAVREARGLASVAAVRPLAASEKLDPALAGRGPLVLAGAVVYGGALDPALDALGSLADVRRVGPAQPDRAIQDVVMLVAEDALGDVAARPEVLYVGPASPALQPEDEGTDQIIAGNVNAARQPVVGYEPWLASLGLDGSGVRVSIVDTGIDESHPDLAGRVVAKVDYSSLSTGEPEDVGGHGTHVSGIVGGSASALQPVTRVKDSAGFLYGLGVAPKVQFVDQNAISSTDCCGWPPSYGWDRLSRDAVRNGSVAWNASWNSLEGVGVGYIESARTMDVMVRDADWPTPGAEPITLVFSAGNGGGTTSTITAPKEAKNIITVGSSKSQRAGAIDTVSSFSSKGPAKDGRILPTITTPGELVVSSRSRVPGGSCNSPLIDGFGFYSSCSGTSMASPHGTGAVALITQWWRKQNGGANPSPAMAKALLINSASDMATADIPNKNEGWGRVNLGALFDPTAQRIYLDQTRVFTELDERLTLTVAPADPSKPLKVTVVWTDAPGAAGASPALVSDLNLTVTAPDGLVYLGNRFSKGWSVDGGSPDRKNNLENVFVQQPAPGTYTIDLAAFNLPGDGVPFSGDETDQDFALVISNAVAAA